MKENLKPLFTPWKIRDVEIKNRIVLCPMGGTSLFGWMRPSGFDEESAKFFLERAKNNVGLIIPGIAPIKDPILGRFLYENKKMFEKLKEFMQEIHKTGAKLFVQLTAGFGRSFAITEPLLLLLKNKFLGFCAKPIMDASYLCSSPSRLPSRWAEGYITRELTKKEIQDMIDAFAKTSKLCMEAGVDGVEVHAVHEGYLLDQFTTKYTNFRQDEYGGSFENRYRFPVEIVKEIKNVCGKNFPVSLRYSVVSKTKGFCMGALPNEEYAEVGRDMQESEKAAKYLQDAGYDMLNADNGTYDAWYWAHPPAYMPKNCNLQDVSHIKKCVDIPVVCAGRMDAEVGAQAVKNGEIDAVGFARQFLADGEWVTKLIEDRPEDILPCICCHNACFPMAHYKGVPNDESFDDVKHMARCALNPLTMQSKKFEIKKTKHPKNIAIIGGGIGGMETARIATLRGHNVTIYEKTDTLGGVFIPASNFDFKEKDRELLEYYRRQIQKLQIKVVYNTEIKDIKSLDVDEIVIATGAKARSLHIAGIEKSMEAVEFLRSDKKIGDNVVIIGGGLTGCEIAYDLHKSGKNPTIIEMKNDLMAICGLCLANSSYLRDYFKWKKVPVFLESKVEKITDEAVFIIDRDGFEKSIKYDDIILSIGYNSAPLVEKGKNVHLVGDAYKVGNLRTVIWRAWEVAEKL